MTRFRLEGLVVDAPEGSRVETPGGARRTRSRIRGARSGGDADALLVALAENDFELANEVDLELPRAKLRRKRGRSMAATFEVELSENQDAVVLLSDGGVFEWRFATAISTPARPRRRGVAASPRVASFDVGPVPNRARQRGGALSMIKAYVLRFTARIAARAAMTFLERKVSTGLVHIRPELERWSRVAPSTLASAAKERGARRVLLMVHGTFSSTIGSFGALAEHDEGQRLLAHASRHYDAVLGFDHASLSLDPQQNAVDMHEHLAAAFGADASAPTFDVVSYSRGGLVSRSWMERLLPITEFRPRVDRSIFVGCTNAGTELARAENWHDLVDLYTTLAVASLRLVGLVPKAKPFVDSLAETVRSLGAFVKYLATHATEEGSVPGLEAMRPDGTFVESINSWSPEQPSPGDYEGYAITSDFSGAFAEDAGDAALPIRIRNWIAARFMRRLMGEPSDLVVHVDSMDKVDVAAGQFIQDRLDFGMNSRVFHTVYFQQPEVARAIATWCGIAGASPR